MRFLFVTKDNGAFNAVNATVRELMARGTAVRVLAEGNSVDRWKQIGINPETEPGDLEAYFELASPEAVVVGASAPINLEAKIARIANERQIPLVIHEDMWGGSRRHHAQAALMITPDAFGEQLAREHPQYSGCPIVKTGFSFLEGVDLGEAVLDRFERHRREGDLRPVVLFAAGARESVQTLEVLLSSLRNSGRPCILVPRFHPKYKGADFETAFWSKIQEFRAANFGRVNEMKDLSTDQVSAFADITVSAAGTSLMHAARHFRIPVNIDLPLVHTVFGEQSVPWMPGFTKNLGIGLSLREPHPEFFRLIEQEREGIIRKQAEYFREPPMTAVQIADAILEYVS